MTENNVIDLEAERKARPTREELVARVKHLERDLEERTNANLEMFQKAQAVVTKNGDLERCLALMRVDIGQQVESWTPLLPNRQKADAVKLLKNLGFNVQISRNPQKNGAIIMPDKRLVVKVGDRMIRARGPDDPKAG